MRESALTQTLDERDLLATARGPGVYALELAVPNDTATATERFAAVSDVEPPDDAITRLAAADTAAYVGASTDVYARLCEHCRGATRTATILEAFEFVGVLNIWPTADPLAHEHNRALRCAQNGWTVWCDGAVYG